MANFFREGKELGVATIGFDYDVIVIGSGFGSGRKPRIGRGQMLDSVTARLESIREQMT
jgi:hypothetical protein